MCEHTFDELEKLLYETWQANKKRKRKVLLEGWRRFVVSSFVVRQLLAKSNKNGTKLITNGTNLAQGVWGERGTLKSTKI